MAKIRIAVWSGPRNISTSLMRSFANRGDCKVIDEPFYGAYLQRTGKQHPLRDEIVKLMSTNFDEIATFCGYSHFDGAIFYQKQMAHHICEDLDLKFLTKLHNVFLIRKPEYVVRSFNEKVESFGLEDIGIKQQVRLFEYIVDKTGKIPLVVSSSDLLDSPERFLRNLCSSLDIEFNKKMLSWPRGPHPDDGVWGRVWYENTNKSTCFIQQTNKEILLSDYQKSIVDSAYTYYEKLASFKQEFL